MGMMEVLRVVYAHMSSLQHGSARTIHMLVAISGRPLMAVFFYQAPTAHDSSMSPLLPSPRWVRDFSITVHTTTCLLLRLALHVLQSLARV